MEHLNRYKWMYISMLACFIIMLLVFSGTDASGGMVFFLSLIFGAVLGAIVYVILRCAHIISDDPKSAVDKFAGGTKEERALEEAYKHGEISFLEYDTLKSKKNRPTVHC